MFISAVPNHVIVQVTAVQLMPATAMPVAESGGTVHAAYDAEWHNTV
jgi:hypothetical protein